jgi:hypothetical protein
MTINQNDKQDLTAEAEYFDYSSASNPLLEKLITPTPYHIFTPEFLHQNTSGILPLDLSKEAIQTLSSWNLVMLVGRLQSQVHVRKMIKNQNLVLNNCHA